MLKNNDTRVYLNLIQHVSMFFFYYFYAALYRKKFATPNLKI